jgi:hypothetical protein
MSEQPDLFPTMSRSRFNLDLQYARGYPREWALFFSFGLTMFGVSPEQIENFEHHINWVWARFASPDDWFGEDGDKMRAVWRMKPMAAELQEQWRNFAKAHKHTGLDEAHKMLAMLLGAE